MTVWAGVLAAGAGRRMGGRPKALLRLGSATFLELISSAARLGGAAGVAAVIGHHSAEVGPVARRRCDAVVTNPAPDRGMGSSARQLARAIPEGAALLLWPVDIPKISPDTVRTLIEASAADPDRLIVPVYGGRRGHPPLLPPSLVVALGELGDEERLDRFIEGACPSPVLIEVDDPFICADVDVQADLADLEGPG